MATAAGMAAAEQRRGGRKEDALRPEQQGARSGEEIRCDAVLRLVTGGGQLYLDAIGVIEVNPP